MYNKYGNKYRDEINTMILVFVFLFGCSVTAQEPSKELNKNSFIPYLKPLNVLDSLGVEIFNLSKPDSVTNSLNCTFVL